MTFFLLFGRREHRWFRYTLTDLYKMIPGMPWIGSDYFFKVIDRQNF